MLELCRCLSLNISSRRREWGGVEWSLVRRWQVLPRVPLQGFVAVVTTRGACCRYHYACRLCRFSSPKKRLRQARSRFFLRRELTTDCSFLPRLSLSTAECRRVSSLPVHSDDPPPPPPPRHTPPAPPPLFVDVTAPPPHATNPDSGSPSKSRCCGTATRYHTVWGPGDRSAATSEPAT